MAVVNVVKEIVLDSGPLAWPEQEILAYDAALIRVRIERYATASVNIQRELRMIDAERSSVHSEERSGSINILAANSRVELGRSIFGEKPSYIGVKSQRLVNPALAKRFRDSDEWRGFGRAVKIGCVAERDLSIE